MEALTAIARNQLQTTRAVLILGVVLGLILGLLIGWVLWPVQWTDATAEVLREDLQRDYLRMTIDSYNRTGDANRAMERWDSLGDEADSTYFALLNDPGYLNTADIQSFGGLIQNVRGAPPTQPAPGAGGTGTSGMRSAVLIASIVVVLALVAVGALYLWRLLRRGTGTITPVMQAAEASRHAEKTNFEEMGLAPPITQTMTTYVLGDDLYDESFSIDTAGGEFLGEYGVGVSETVGVGEPKKVAALEIWLFDKNDIKTATKVLMSEYAYNDPNIRARLEPKGELVVVKPQEQVLLETATLQLLATVVDMEYGTGAMPQNSYFERITLELAIWPRSGQ
ncbi:MAG TPA: hypothetical protein VFO91_11090 [Anaerolineales bacterium]|nr:hypothetical protein [Anaerolineales bacterium]